MIKTTLLIVALLLVALVAYWGIKFYLTVQTSKKLIHAAVPYQNRSSDISTALLVLGDSTGVGVGAETPSDTLGGRVASYIGATYTENEAVSGAVTKDLPGQIKKAKLSHYHLILIQIGGNDIIRFHSAKAAGEELQIALSMLPSADKVVIISAGDVGGATLFPFFIRPFHTLENKAYNTAFSDVAQKNGATYVNLTVQPSTKTIKDSPKVYLAPDGLHPSSKGYALWLDSIKSALPQ